MIFTSLSPNTGLDDVRRAIGTLLKPWSWKEGKAEGELKKEVGEFLGVSHLSFFESGRTSLYAILKALGVSSGDEVLIQAYTCVAVPEPILWVGAEPVYVDCDEKTLTMDANDLARKITKKSKVVIVQHTFGFPADMDAIMSLAKKHELFVIEDCAHAIGAKYKRKKVGTMGDAAFFSFGRDKVISSVFGGFTASAKADLGGKIEKIREGFSYPSAFWIFQQLNHPIIFSIAKPVYGFLGLGKIIIEIAKRLRLFSMAVEPIERKGGKPSFAFKKMPNALAILALGQFRKLGWLNRRRLNIAAFYDQRFSKTSIGLPMARKEDESIYLRYTIQTEGRDDLMQFARSRGILLGDWYSTPLAPDGVVYDLVGYKRDCPVAERLAKTSLNLPTHIQLSFKETMRVADIVREWAGGYVAREIVDKSVWDGFIDLVTPSTFLHSWAWGEAEKRNGRKVSRFGVYEGDKIVAAFASVLVKARRGSIMLCPHGPVIAKGADMSRVMKVVRDELREKGCAEDCVVVRVCPISPDSPDNRFVFKRLGFRHAPIHVYPELSWILDITPDEEALLAGMKKNTRYGIRKAEKDGVSVSSSVKAEDFELFWKIYMDTANRQSFVPHPEKLVRGEFEELSKDDRIRMYFSYHDGKPVSTAFIVYGAHSAFYHHGASLPHNAITPGEMLQWQIIKDAKARGLSRYNFWGVVPEGEKDHAWARLDKFKRGFGGREEAYVPAQDYPLSWKYVILFAIETVRRWKRRV